MYIAHGDELRGLISLGSLLQLVEDGRLVGSILQVTDIGDTIGVYELSKLDGSVPVKELDESSSAEYAVYQPVDINIVLRTFWFAAIPDVRAGFAKACFGEAKRNKLINKLK